MNNMSKETNKNTEKMLTLKELCREISISTATGRNWLKLEKIKPDCMEGNKAYFSKEYVRRIKEDIQSSSNKVLKSRRNKKYVSGNALYTSYVSESSVNVRTVQELLGIIEQYDIRITDENIQFIIAECAIQLLREKINGDSADYKHIKNAVLNEYIKGDVSLDIYNDLLDDLIEDVDGAKEFIQSYPSIFDLSYTFEKGEDILGLIYMSCRNIGSRKAAGSYYTPTKVVSQLVQQIEGEGKTIIDPCCGTGNFLLQLPEDIALENIYGNDLDSISVKITRINMALKYKVENVEILYRNITVSNFLENDDNKSYDCIIGNPPWGYEFSSDECGFLRGNYKSAVGKNIESYDVFVECALLKLKQNGVVSFVLPEAILNVKSHMPIRKVIADSCNIDYLAYLGNVFHKVQCPSIIMQIKKTKRGMTTAGMRIQDGSSSFVVETERIINPELFNFKMTDGEYNIIQKIKNLSDVVYLKNNATFALGIVTGNNEEYITHEKTVDNEVVIKGADIEKYRINDTHNYITFIPEKFQQVAPVQYYRASEKLLYRFIGDKLVFAYDDKQRITLNSCNMLIPHIEGMDIKYILAVLNSSVAQFFYEKEFGSVKILRSHIEQIPIPKAGADKQQQIIHIVDKILEYSLKNQDITALSERLDMEIAKLYRIE